MAVEEKWRANQAKVAFMKEFPGLLDTWQTMSGKTIQTVTPLTSKPGAAVVVFTDGSFAVTPPLAPEPWLLGEALTVARPLLEAWHPKAYAEYDRLVHADKEALKAARVEKILGAVQNNVQQIPELKDRLRELIKQWK